VTTKKKLPDEVKELLKGYSAVSSTVTVKIEEEKLGEHAPEFVIHNFSVADTHTISRLYEKGNGVHPDLEPVEEILRVKMASIKNLWDEDEGDFIERKFEKGVGCDEELYSRIPFTVRMTIFTKMMNLNGLM